MNFLPLLTSIVAFAFTAALARLYLERRKFHQILWTMTILFYGTTPLMEFLMNPDARAVGRHSLHLPRVHLQR